MRRAIDIVYAQTRHGTRNASCAARHDTRRGLRREAYRTVVGRMAATGGMAAVGRRRWHRRVGSATRVREAVAACMLAQERFCLSRALGSLPPWPSGEPPSCQPSQCLPPRPHRRRAGGEPGRRAVPRSTKIPPPPGFVRQASAEGGAERGTCRGVVFGDQTPLMGARGPRNACGVGSGQMGRGSGTDEACGWAVRAARTSSPRASAVARRRRTSSASPCSGPLICSKGLATAEAAAGARTDASHATGRSGGHEWLAMPRGELTGPEGRRGVWVFAFGAAAAGGSCDGAYSGLHWPSWYPHAACAAAHGHTRRWSAHLGCAPPPDHRACGLIRETVGRRALVAASTLSSRRTGMTSRLLLSSRSATWARPS